ncbi:MAG: PD-(D/E)XK nuclease family protein [Candidatus Cloacimonetes bacterium]|nr:PD-(D/E)XK nuclease family protein [Candidatus Cloacimonadota bacterium]
MGSYNFKFAEFDQDINQVALKEELQDNTIFVFPSHQSKKAAKSYYLNNFPIKNIKFLTIEEWKCELFPAKNILLKDIKRIIALFNSFKKGDKKYLKIKDFHRFKNFATKVFNFWEEINEELISFSDIENLLYIKEGGADWQFEMLSRLQQNYKLYQEYLQNNNFTDPVFRFDLKNLDISILNDYEKIVIVNQFYFTELEKKILRKLTDKSISICYQLSEKFVDKEKLKIKEKLTAKDISEFLTEQIVTIESDDKFSQISALFSFLEEKSISNIVDFNFFKSSYSRFFAKKYFKIKTTQKFTTTSLYQFFCEVTELISSLIYMQEDEKYLISLEQLKNSLLSRRFLNYFLDSDSVQDCTTLHEKLKKSLYDLIGKNYNFLNLNGNFLQWHKFDENVQDIFRGLFRFIRVLIQVNSLNAFVEFLFKKIDVESILTTVEKNYSDILKIYHQLILDFESIERLGLINNKLLYFTDNKNQNSNIKFAKKILKFFLEHLRQQEVNYLTKVENDNKINVTNLHSTRNLQFRSLAILNVVEGVLPPTKKSTFLLFENQRKKIGLKSYEDIVLREKYYFYRLLAQTKNVFIFHINDMNENISTSSFLEELMLFLPSELFTNIHFYKHDYYNLHKTILDDKRPIHKVNHSKKVTDEFFRFSSDDDKINQRFLSTFTPTKWLQLSRNPFIFYLKYVLGFDELDTELDSYFNLKFIGLFTHKLFELIWNQLKSERNLIDFSKVPKLLESASFMNKIEKNLFTKINLKYKKFNRSSDYYLLNIYFEILLNNIKNFFRYLNEEFDKRPVNSNRILTESSSLTFEELPEFFTSDSFDDLSIHLGGRADLLIEDEQYKLLVDYKTSKFNLYKKTDYREQIIIYALIYFILQHENDYEKIKSYLYFIGNDYFYGVRVNKKSILKFKNKMNNMLSRIKENGYFANPSDSYDITEITRSDLI